MSPLAHVNLHQSTNDTYPTALKITLIELVREAAQAAAALQGSLQRKEKEFAPIVTAPVVATVKLVAAAFPIAFATPPNAWRLLWAAPTLGVNPESSSLRMAMTIW